MVRRHRVSSNQVTLEDWRRELQIFIFSVIIGLALGAFAVLVFSSLPKMRENQHLFDLLQQYSDAYQKCMAGKSEVVAPISPVPQPAVKPTPEPTLAPKPQATPEVKASETLEDTALSGQVPVPRRAPPRPTGESPKIAVQAGAALAMPLTASLKVGEEKELAPRFRLRLSAISKRRSGNFCVLSGAGLPTTGLRVAHNSSVKITWNGQKISVGVALLDKQSCKITVRPVS
jgi:hypothetical protein